MQTHMAIPCCPARGSVSTWAPENALNKELNQSRVVIPVSLLIRWVRDHRKANVLNVCVSQRYSQYPRKLGTNTLNYGEGPKKLAHTLNVDVEEAKSLIEKYFEPYPRVRAFINDCHRRAREHGMVETIIGRPRRFPEMFPMRHLTYGQMSGEQRAVASQIDRQSVNSSIQGCKDIDSYVMTTAGPYTLKQLLTLEQKPALYTYTGHTTSYTVYGTGEKPVYSLHTTHGTEYVTNEHRFFVYEDEDIVTRKLRDLKVGDFIVAAAPIIHDGTAPENATPELAELIGILCGDGNYTRARDFRICFGNDFEWKDHIVALLHNVFGSDTHCALRKSNGSLGDSWYIDVSAKKCRQKLLELGLECAARENKKIPAWIFQAPIEHRIACLRGLFDSDGDLVTENPVFTNISEHLVRGFSLLCHTVGIFTSISCDNEYASTKVFRSRVVTNQATEFIELIQPAVTCKQVTSLGRRRTKLPPALIARIANCILQSSSWQQTSEVRLVLQNGKPGSWRERTHTAKEKTHFGRGEQAHVYRMRAGSGTAAYCVDFLERIKDDPAIHDQAVNLLDLASTPWARIKKIELVGPRTTADIEIHDTEHAYIGHGLLQHNSAADVAKLAMIKCEFSEPLKKLGVRQLLQIHDELIFEVPIENVKEAARIIKDLMEHPLPFELSVPLTIDLGVGTSWAAAKG